MSVALYTLVYFFAIVGFLRIFGPFFEWIAKDFFPRVHWGNILGLAILIVYTVLAALGCYQLYSWWA